MYAPAYPQPPPGVYAVNPNPYQPQPYAHYPAGMQPYPAAPQLYHGPQPPYHGQPIVQPPPAYVVLLELVPSPYLYAAFAVAHMIVPSPLVLLQTST